MLAGDALRNALAAQAGSSSPRTVDAVRSAQEQASAALSRYADELAANPPDACAPRRIEIAAQADEPADGAAHRRSGRTVAAGRGVAGLARRGTRRGALITGHTSMKARTGVRDWRWRRGLLCVAWMASVLSGCALIHHDGTPYTEIAPEQISLANDIHLARDGWPAARWWTRYQRCPARCADRPGARQCADDGDCAYSRRAGQVGCRACQNGIEPSGGGARDAGSRACFRERLSRPVRDERTGLGAGRDRGTPRASSGWAQA